MKYGTHKWDVKVLKCNYSKVWLKVRKIRKLSVEGQPSAPAVLTEGVGGGGGMALSCDTLGGGGAGALSLNRKKGGFGRYCCNRNSRIMFDIFQAVETRDSSSRLTKLLRSVGFPMSGELECHS